MCHPTITTAVELQNLQKRVGVETRQQRRALRTQQQQQQQVVRFSQEVHTCCKRPPSVTEEEIRGIWYQQSEIANFRILARDLILFYSSTSATTEDDNNHESLCGFERYSLERRNKKLVAMHFIMLASRKQVGLCPESVGVIARLFSAQAQERALIQGCQDYCEAYQPALKHLIPTTISAEFPDALFPTAASTSTTTRISLEPNNKKRAAEISTTCNEPIRRVGRRSA
jgi:hypothetical protein